ncbi:MAG: helix-turn-helix domain-containing protein [Actinomycetota bacterium]
MTAAKSDDARDKERGDDTLEREHHEYVARAIKVLRAARGMGRKHLAAAAGVSYPYLAEIEAARKHPSSKALLAIAQALDVKPHELLAAADQLASMKGPGLAGGLPIPGTLGDTPAKTRTLTSDPTEELGRLARLMEPEDLDRVLDLARRLAVREDASLACPQPGRKEKASSRQPADRKEKASSRQPADRKETALPQKRAEGKMAAPSRRQAGRTK